MLANVPLVPKNADGVLRVISIGRLSKPKNTPEETKQSLEAMRCENERLLSSIYSGPKIVHYLAEQISGMIAMTRTSEELWELVESGAWDLIIAEDLSRVFRNPAFQWNFVLKAFDAKVRVVCFADGLDTAEPQWMTMLSVAALRHGLMIPDTRRRINRTATNTFEDGGMVMKVKFGYEKVSRKDAKDGKYGSPGLRVRRLKEFAWVFDEIRARLTEGTSPQTIVDWLIAKNVPVGPYVTSGEWTFKLFKELVTDPILNGNRMFRDIIHRLVYTTGDYEREKNPTPEIQDCPELAFMTRQQQEQMLAAVGWRIDWGGVKPSAKPHPRKGITRYQSCWPGQSTTCAVCGDTVFACGKYLRCSNSFHRLGETCWNHIQAPIAPLRKVVVTWLVNRCHVSAEFLNTLLEGIKPQLQQQRSRQQSRCDMLDAEIADLQNQERNLRTSIRMAKKVTEQVLESLVLDLADVTEQLRLKRQQAKPAESTTEPLSELSDEKIVARLEEVLTHLVNTSFEMNELLRGLVPRCEIVVVQALDSSQVHPRAKLSFRTNLDDPTQLEELVVDLFTPPVHIRCMTEIVKLRSQEPRPTLKEIARLLEICHMTVKRGIAYDKLMQELGVTEPFRELHAKPENAARWRHSA